MDGMEAVAVEEVIESSPSGESTESTPQVDTEKDDPYSSKSSKAYSEWIKAQREAFKDDPNASKFLRLSKDNHARLYQLQQMEPRGIDGIREKYAMLDSVVHGELKGVDAVGALQDELRSVQELDERLFSGDANALKEMGDEFVQQALPKLAGPILEMVRDTNPEAYLTAVLPHVVEAIREQVIPAFNGMVDVLKEAPPKWLTENQKAQWTEDRIQRVIEFAAKMGNNINTMAGKASELPKQQAGMPKTAGEKPSDLDMARKEVETAHWNNNIQPNLDKHAESQFSKLFAPYAKRLRLDGNATADLKQSFIQGVVKKSVANPVYASQLQRYHSQRKPDPNTVSNFAKVEFDKHAKSVMDGLVNQRYKPFLNGRSDDGKRIGTTTTFANGQPRKGPVGPGVRISTVKPDPNKVNWRATKPELRHDNKFVMNDGSIVHWQR